MLDPKTKQENEKQEGLDEFEQFVKDIFTLPPETVKEILDREKQKGIPRDPGGAYQQNS